MSKKAKREAIAKRFAQMFRQVAEATKRTEASGRKPTKGMRRFNGGK